MPRILPRPKSPTPVGLQIGSTHACAVALDRRRVVAAASVDLEPGVVVDGDIARPEALTDSLRELFAHGRFGKRVYLGLSMQHGVVRLLDMPLIEDPRERDTAVRFQAAEAIAMPLEDAILDYAFVGQDVSAHGGARMSIVLAAARRAPVAELVACVRKAGLQPEGLELEPFALVRALARPSGDNEPARLYCHLGDSAVLAVAVGDTCLFTRSAPASGPGLAEQLRLLLGYYANQPGSQPVVEVVVSGIDPGDADALGLLGVPVGIDVRVASPFAELEQAPSARIEADPRPLTLAAGLALGALA